MFPDPLPRSEGPYYVEDLQPGDPYELSDGRLIECLPAGGRHGNHNSMGAVILESDPEVSATGTDVGVELRTR